MSTVKNSNWIFDTLDELIDCEYDSLMEEDSNANNKGKRPLETLDDFRKSRGNNEE